MEIILNELRQVPIACWIHSSKKVLPGRSWYSQYQVSKPVAAISGSQVGGVPPWEAELSTRRSQLKEVPLLATEVNAELEGVLVTDPCDGVCNLINVFNGVLRRPQRITHGGEAGDILKRQS